VRVLVFEPDHSGHHFAYLNWMLPAISALGAHTVLVTSTEAPSTEPYRMLIRPLEAPIDVDASAASDPGSSPWQLARSRSAELMAAVARHRADHVMMPYGDGLAQALAVRRLTARRTFPRGVTSECLLFRGAFAYPASGTRRRVANRASWELARRAPVTYFHHLDPLVYERIGSPRWSLMPDPVERPPPLTSREARRRLEIPLEGRYIGCVGIIDSRKGADLLIEAFARAGLGPDDRLLLAGPHHPDVLALLAGPHAGAVREGRIISINSFLPIDALQASLFALDVVGTPYPNHIGSASIVIRAAAAGRPVLGSNYGWVGRTVPQFGLGRTCDVSDAASFADNIRPALDESAGWRLTPAAERFVRFHSAENFSRACCVRLRQIMGFPPEPGALSWEWVLEAARGSFEDHTCRSQATPC
jgi:glycosyltransferase involved in cell wall biosynthesis